MKRTHIPWLVLLFIGNISLVFSEALTHELAPSDWPQWRGPSRNGRVHNAAWPNSIDEDHLTLMWDVDHGPSYSGTIVVGDKVFTTETLDKTTEVVFCHDRNSGKAIWSTEWPGAMTVPFFAKRNGSWIRATPACDGDTLYVAGMCDVLYALNCENGETRWSIDFKTTFDTPTPTFGFASSPIVFDNAVFVQAGGGFVKLNKNTGEVIWRVATDGGGMNGSAFSSPVHTKLNDRHIMLVQARTALKGIDPSSGEELWSQDIQAFRGMNILTPTVYNNTIFTSAHSGRSQLWKIESSPDGIPEALQEIWLGNSQAYMSSPVRSGHHLYLHLKNQRIACIDLENGEETWRTTPFGQYQSMIICDDKILALDEGGELLLISADPKEFKLMDRRTISEDETWAHLAISGDQIFVRSLHGLAAYRWK
ncbi:MAG: PQQ-binding-like beta-propeller repeat protein [Pirellulales bacterium]